MPDRGIHSRPSISVQVTSTAEVRTENREQLTAAHVAEWVTALPPDAVLVPLTVDVGSQRDPEHRFIGLKATWSETKSAPTKPGHPGGLSGGTCRG